MRWYCLTPSHRHVEGSEFNRIPIVFNKQNCSHLTTSSFSKFCPAVFPTGTIFKINGVRTFKKENVSSADTFVLCLANPGSRSVFQHILQFADDLFDRDALPVFMG
jgi:hypothetical protein